MTAISNRVVTRPKPEPEPARPEIEDDSNSRSDLSSLPPSPHLSSEPTPAPQPEEPRQSSRECHAPDRYTGGFARTAVDSILDLIEEEPRMYRQATKGPMAP